MRNLKLSFFSLLITFLGIININAVNQTTGAMVKSDNGFRFDGTEIVNANFGDPNTIFYKYAGEISYVCISGINAQVAADESCIISSDLVASTKQIGVAYIIEKVTGEIGGIANMFSLKEKYYWLELAILKYLDKGDGITLTDDVINAQIRNITGLTYNELKNNADVYAAKYSKDIDINIVLENSTNEIVFTEKNDVYLSQKIYLKDVNNNADKIVTSIIDNSDAEIIEGADVTGKFYQIKINNDKVQGKKVTATLKVDASNEYYVASFYDCSNGQDLMATVTEKQTKTDTTSIRGEIKSTQLTIYNEDEKGNYLEGIVLSVESKDNNYKKSFIAGNKPLVLNDLKYGVYTITEVSVPKGYSILKTPKTIILSESNLLQEVTLVNKLNQVKIKIINADDGSLLKGATLQIQTEDGNVIDEWKTTNKEYMIEGLEKGTYYLVETSALEGFELNKEKIKFVIEETTDIKELEIKNNLEVEVPDTLSSKSALLIVIAMFDIALGIGILTYVKNRKIEE